MSKSLPTTVLLVDDHNLIRQGLARVTERHPRVQRGGERCERGGSGGDLAQRLTLMGRQPDVRFQQTTPGWS